MKVVKQGRKRGVTTTHPALVHIDDDNWSFWQNLPNKSRFVNECCSKQLSIEDESYVSSLFKE